MRIVSWNCNMGFEKKREALLSFQPDIVVLQECSAISGSPIISILPSFHKSY